MSCFYCENADKLDLLPAAPCVIGQDAEGTNYWTSFKITKQVGQTFMGHRMKQPLLSYLNYHIICKDNPKYEILF